MDAASSAAPGSSAAAARGAVVNFPLEEMDGEGAQAAQQDLDSSPKSAASVQPAATVARPSPVAMPAARPEASLPARIDQGRHAGAI